MHRMNCDFVYHILFHDLAQTSLNFNTTSERAREYKTDSCHSLHAWLLAQPRFIYVAMRTIVNQASDSMMTMT